jgi:DNA-binding MarR family transcriptional regulator
MGKTTDIATAPPADPSTAPPTDSTTPPTDSTAPPTDRSIAPAVTGGGSRHADPELAARLRLVLNRLARRLRSQTPDDLSPSLTSALVTIELRGPITLGRLASCERVTPPSVTRMVATLEQRGLVRREADAGDRRVARVSLTAEGRRTVQRTRTRKTAYLARRLRKLDESQLAIVREALPVLERLLEDDS